MELLTIAVILRTNRPIKTIPFSFLGADIFSGGCSRRSRREVRVYGHGMSVDSMPTNGICSDQVGQTNSIPTVPSSISHLVTRILQGNKKIVLIVCKLYVWIRIKYLFDRNKYVVYFNEEKLYYTLDTFYYSIFTNVLYIHTDRKSFVK